MFLVICVFFCFVLFGLFFYIYNNFVYHAKKTYLDALSILGDKIDENLKLSQGSMFSILSANSDLVLMDGNYDNHASVLAASRLRKTIESSITFLPTAEGLFVYSHKADQIVAFSRVSRDTTALYVLSMLRSADYTSFYHSVPTTYRKWTFVNLGNQVRLMKMNAFNGFVGGAWVNPASLVNYIEKELPGTRAFFAADGSSAYFPDENAPSKTYTRGSFSRNSIPIVAGYLELSYQLNTVKEDIVLLIPEALIASSLTCYIPLAVGFALLLLAVFIIIYCIINRQLNAPIEELRRLSHTLQDGTDEGTLLELGPSACTEVNEMYIEVRKLNDSINMLRENVYKEAAAKTAFELQSLKNQVSPHALINYLSAISSIMNIGTPNLDVIRQMIKLLSSHLRYILSSKSNVLLSREMEHLETFYRLTSIRCPDSLTYHFDVADTCLNASIFPGLLLMLSENSIKHNLVPMQLLIIYVRVIEEADAQGNSFLHIIHEDSGHGFPPEILDRLNNLKNADLSTISDGNGIGLYNIVKRIQLAYRDRGSVRFSNRNDSGARIEIRIPFIQYQET